MAFMAPLPETGIQKVRGPGTCTVTPQEILMLVQLVYQLHFEKHCLALSPSCHCPLLLILYSLHFPLPHRTLPVSCQGETQVTPNVLQVHPTSVAPTYLPNLFHPLTSVSNSCSKWPLKSGREGKRLVIAVL